jgi:KUP system potassium uptake protein
MDKKGQIWNNLVKVKVAMTHRNSFSGILKALGLVFGDIGTSPIYTLTVIFVIIQPTPANIMGILSLITWTLIIIVFVEYVLLAMTLNLHGEGGTLIIKRILDDLLPNGKRKIFFGILAFAGVALLIGDGVITPSISILSAVEGLVLIPGLEQTPQWVLIGGAMLIAIMLFAVQPSGTDKIAGSFGPVMVVWFIALSSSGIISIAQNPVVLKAVNPFYAVEFMRHHGLAGFLILSQVILCATGSEALYADMGHLGKKPIVKAWNYVFIALILNYLGQGSFLISHPEAKNLLFSMVHSQSATLYIPFLLLTVLATVIASQALISGVFSIVYQGINSGVFPRMRVSFTSKDLKSQIYINAVNIGLMLSVLLMLLLFKKSENLAVAYGLAVTGTMCITGIIMIKIFHRRHQNFRAAAAFIVTAVDFSFFFANFTKLKEGGYWSLIIASVPFLVILLWTRGQKKIYTCMRSLAIDTFLPGYTQIYEKGHNIPGTALFFVGNPKQISPYIIHSIVRHGIIYEKNILFTVIRTDYAYGVEFNHDTEAGKGLEIFKVLAGYRENIDIGKILDAAKINPKAIFYGIEDISTESIVWKVFSVIKKLTPSFVKYYKIPGTKLVGIIFRVDF